MAQTAVNWFIQQIFKTNNDMNIDEMIDKAKEMEKQQIINAYDLGSLSEMQYPNPETIIENGEQYYNEAFKAE